MKKLSVNELKHMDGKIVLVSSNKRINGLEELPPTICVVDLLHRRVKGTGCEISFDSIMLGLFNVFTTEGFDEDE